MASASDIAVHFHIPTPCSLCDEEDDVNSFCKECLQYLCDRCKRLHGKSPYLKNHHIVHYTEGYKIHKDESVVCEDHNEILSFFCRTCSKHICNKCLTSKTHRSHEFTDIHTYSEEVTDRIQKKIAEERAKNDVMKNEMKKIVERNNKRMRECDENIAKIKDSVDTLVDKARNLQVEMTEKQKSIKEEIVYRNQKTVEDIEFSISQNEQRLVDVATNLKRQSNVSVVGFEREVTTLLQQIQISHSPTSDDMCGVQFVSSSLDTSFVWFKTLKDLIGQEVKNTALGCDDNFPSSKKEGTCLKGELSILNKSEIPSKNSDGRPAFIRRLCVIDEDSMCIAVDGEKLFSYKLLLCNDCGNIFESLYTCGGHRNHSAFPNGVVYVDGNILVASLSSLISKVCCRTGMVTSFAEVSGFAGSMVLTQDKCILVNIIQGDKRPVIQKYTIEGRMLETIILSSNLDSVFTTSLSNIKPYIDGKYLVRYEQKIFKMNDNYVFEEISRLGCLLKEFCYTSDKYGHVIFVKYDGEVFIIDHNGYLVQKYQDAIDLLKGETVSSIAVDPKCRLWLGTNRGNVIIASYMKE